MCLGYYMPAFIIQFQIPNSQIIPSFVAHSNS